ncbi:MAG: pur operon repressor [Bacillota bacterium]
MKLKRKERIGGIIKVLTDNPNKIYNLKYFTKLFSAAKSSVSEDITFVKEIIEKLHMGEVITLVGASGGVKYIPSIQKDKILKVLEKIIDKINEKDRVIPGGLVYTLDILYTPKYLKSVAKVFSYLYKDKKIDYVLTIETKGIPLATITAELLNVPLVVARDENKLTEGSTLGINYVSGSTGKVKTMFVSKRSIKKGSNILIVDDFIRGGGTAKGLKNLVKELESFVVGTCFLIDINNSDNKMVKEYNSLIKLTEIDKNRVNAELDKNFFKKIKGFYN